MMFRAQALWKGPSGVSYCAGRAWTVPDTTYIGLGRHEWFTC